MIKSIFLKIQLWRQRSFFQNCNKKLVWTSSERRGVNKWFEKKNNFRLKCIILNFFLWIAEPFPDCPDSLTKNLLLSSLIKQLTVDSSLLWRSFQVCSSQSCFLSPTLCDKTRNSLSLWVGVDNVRLGSFVQEVKKNSWSNGIYKVKNFSGEKSKEENITRSYQKVA